MQTGNSASPDCFKTWAGLGADASFSTLQCAVPMPVSVAIQPSGMIPGLASSKFTHTCPAPDEHAREQARMIRKVLTYAQAPPTASPTFQSEGIWRANCPGRLRPRLERQLAPY